MKIHVEFSGLSDMATFTKFINDSLVPPTQKELKAKAQEDKRNAELAGHASRLEALLDRAYERIAMLDPKGETAHLSPEEYRNKKLKEAEEILEAHVSKLEITNRTLNCLTAENITKVRQLIECTENDVLRIPNFGRGSLKDLKDQLAIYGLKLKSK